MSYVIVQPGRAKNAPAVVHDVSCPMLGDARTRQTSLTLPPEPFTMCRFCKGKPFVHTRVRTRTTIDAHIGSTKPLRNGDHAVCIVAEPDAAGRRVWMRAKTETYFLD